MTQSALRVKGMAASGLGSSGRVPRVTFEPRGHLNQTRTVSSKNVWWCEGRVGNFVNSAERNGLGTDLWHVQELI